MTVLNFTQSSQERFDSIAWDHRGLKCIKKGNISEQGGLIINENRVNEARGKIIIRAHSSERSIILL